MYLKIYLGKKLKNTVLQTYGGLEMRHFEKTGEKLKRLTVSGGKKSSPFSLLLSIPQLQVQGITWL